jgi:hypothetical protein
LIGAYILAGALARATDTRAALARYQLLIRALHAGARLVSSHVGKALGAVTGNRMNSAEQLPLPDYSHEISTAT